MALELTAKARTKTGSKHARAIRETGELPAVLYGAVEKTQPITLTTSEFVKVWKTAGESTLVSLVGLKDKKLVLIQDVTIDPLYDKPVHADLFAVKADEVVEVDVPLVFVGVAAAEKDLGGILVKVMHELAIEALPKDLPHQIEVDLSKLQTFDDQVHVSDIVLPNGVKARANASDVVALTQEPKEEEEELPTEAVDVTAVEIEKKGKEDEEPAPAE